MAQHQHTHSLPHLEEAMTVLFCLIDDAYRLLNPRGARRYESIKRLSDSEIITLALLQQLRGVESERSFLRDAQRFFSELFPGVALGALPTTRSGVRGWPRRSLRAASTGRASAVWGRGCAVFVPWRVWALGPRLGGASRSV